MKKIAKFVVKFRFLLSVIFAVLVILSACLIAKVNINYDMI